jgi:H+-transporting ATPase
MLSIEGIAMAPLPAWIVAFTLAAAAVFAVVANLVKVPAFRLLRIALNRASLSKG